MTTTAPNDILARLNVSAKEIEEFCARWGVREFAVFGSAARGDMRPDSDVDVMVELDPGAPRRPWGLGGIQQGLVELFGRDVDVISKGPIENPFKRASIMRDLTVLYAA